MCLCIKITYLWFHAMWNQFSVNRSVSVRVNSSTNYIRNDSRGNKNTNVVQIVQPGRISLVDWCICFVWWPVLLARPGESHSSAKKGTSAQYLLDLRYIFVFR